MKITKEDFQKYEKVRSNGKINMLSVSLVVKETGLHIDKIFTIMEYYEDLANKYL